MPTLAPPADALRQFGRMAMSMIAGGVCWRLREAILTDPGDVALF